jgi:hypothetical protein
VVDLDQGSVWEDKRQSSLTIMDMAGVKQPSLSKTTGLVADTAEAWASVGLLQESSQLMLLLM